MTTVNPLDYFNTTQLPEEYDFNNDGKIDISDYNYAISTLEDTDPDNDVKFEKEELDNAFATIIQDAFDDDDETATEDTAKDLADKIIAAMKEETLSPDNATTLNNLQTIGKTLTKFIKYSADVAKILATQIEEKEKELETIEEEKEEKEKEYLGRVQDVENKKTELAEKINAVLAASQSMSEQRKKEAESIINQTVDDYKDGKYPDKELHEIIKYNLMTIGGYNTSMLARQLRDATSVGDEIKSICTDIDSLVGDIKTITENYNSKTTEINALKDSRTGVLEAANTASTEYQKGYQKRLDMRQEIIDTYHVDGEGEDKKKSSNPQVQKLALFLDNKELDNMPYADAWNILQNTFDDCGLKFGENGKISVPKGHNDTAKNIYNALVDALKRNYSDMTVDQYEDEEEGYTDADAETNGVTNVKVKRTDPISFINGDMKYDFINDTNNNGVFDDASEFMGSKNGWAEMNAYDTNADGKISGDELKNLKMVGSNQTNGQFTFTTAADAGITSIDLNSYNDVSQKGIDGNITVGTFNIQMDGKTIQGFQTEDTEQNLNNQYATFFGSKIDDLSSTYEANPFMEDMEEQVNTKEVQVSSQNDIKKNEKDAENVLKTAEIRDNNSATRAAIKGTYEKKIADKREEEKEKAEERKKAAEDEE